MALHGFEQFNAGGFNQPQQGGFQMPQLNNFNAMPDNFGKGGVFDAADPMKGLQLDFATDPFKGAGDENNFMKMAFGGQNADGSSQMGFVNGGLGAIAGIGQAVLGYKQYGLAKKELAFQKEQARINNESQMTLLNNQMRGGADRERVASGGQSPTGDEYVSMNGIKL